MQNHCFTCSVILNDSHTVHMLTQQLLLPTLTSTVKLSLFKHGHSSPLSLVSRLHWCRVNCSLYINNGWTFSGHIYNTIYLLPMCVYTHIYTHVYTHIYMYVCIHTYEHFRQQFLNQTHSYLSKLLLPLKLRIKTTGMFSWHFSFLIYSLIQLRVLKCLSLN